MSGPAPLPIPPEHPELRQIALAIESAGISAEIFERTLKTVFFSTESARVMGLTAEERRRVYGLSMMGRVSGEATADPFETTEEICLAWIQQNLPILRRFVEPGMPNSKKSSPILRQWQRRSNRSTRHHGPGTTGFGWLPTYPCARPISAIRTWSRYGSRTIPVPLSGSWSSTRSPISRSP